MLSNHAHRSPGWRRNLSAGVVLVGPVVLAGLLAGVPAAGANGIPPQVRALGDYRLGADPNPLRGKSGQALAVDPANADHIVELHQDLLREECEYNVSTDGGVTWSGGDLQAPAGFPTSNPGPCSVLGHGAQNVDQSGIEVGTGNNVYVTFASNKTVNQTGYSVMFARSQDGGANYPVATEVLAGGAAGSPDYSFPELSVDRGAGTGGADRIYISVGDTRTARVLLVRSDDSGATWTAPVEVSNVAATSPTYNCPTPSTCTLTAPGDAHKLALEATQPLLGPAGTGGAASGVRPIYIAWRTQKSSTCGANPPGNCVGPPGNETAAETTADGYIVLATSLDSGATWTRRRVVNARGYIYTGPVTPPYSRTPTYFQGSNFPRIALDPGDGTLYLTYNQAPGLPGSDSCGTGPFPGPGPGTNTCPSYGAASAGFGAADHFINNDNDVWFMRSTDGGAAWSNPTQINDPKKGGLAAPEVTQTRHPTIGVAPNGRVDIVWQDRRHWYLTTSRRASPTGVCTHTHVGCDDTRLGDTYYVSSADKGVTFSANRRVNDRTQGLDVGFDYRFSSYWDYGPVSVPLGNDQILVADMDSREGNFDNDTQDIYLRKVNLNAGTGPIPVDGMGTADAAGLTTAFSRRANPGGSEGQVAATFTSRASTKLVVVNEGDVAAAAVGSVLARATVGPLLASPFGALPLGVTGEIRRMKPVAVYVVGHTNALSTGIERDLMTAGVPGDKIIRIAGDPAEQAASVARTLDWRTSADITNGLPAFDAAIITKANSPESASATALAANRRLPILYVETNSIPAATSSALTSLNIAKTLVVGGPAVVSDAVMAGLPSPTRLGGADQYATSNAVVTESVSRGLPTNLVYVADGDKPMQAALMGAAVARLGGLLLLSPGGSTALAETTVGTLGLRPVVDRLVSSTLNPVAAVPPAAPLNTDGYRLVAGDGGIFNFGNRIFRGSTGGMRLNKPIVGGATDPTTKDGYWLVASDGGVFSFNVPFFGSLAAQGLPAPAVEIEPAPSGRGYWIVLANGQVYPFGDAQHFGDLAGVRLNKPVIGMSVTKTGRGYWLVAEDGGIFSFGDARFFGSTGSMRLNAPVIDLAPAPDNNGYLLVAKDGGVFAYGSALFRGSTGSIKLNAPVVSILMAPSGIGYWLGASDGGVFTFGFATFLGSMGGTRLNSPILDLID